MLRRVLVNGVRLVRTQCMAQREKDSRQLAVGSKYGTTDYRTMEKQKIVNCRFTPIIADQQTAKR